MLVNFFHSVLKPTIESHTVSSEGFELSNLISSDDQLLQKGFLAERFISCPVFIRIKFICPVNVKNIIIWSQVGRQKSCGFELSVLNNDGDLKRFAVGTIPDFSNGIIFSKEGSKFSEGSFSPDVKSFARSTFFRNKAYEKVETIQVKIFKSHFVPAIKKIEIWGEPHRTCDAKTINHVVDRWFNAQQIATPISKIEKTSDTEKNEYLLQTHSMKIPDEFYDEITHEVMTLPMILPSGKIIDHRTLEKFQEEEAKWGRLPSDPFTGVLFTDRSKPVIAAALKSNIDSFLLKYSDMNDLKCIPRRLGSCKENFSSLNIRVSKILESETFKRKLYEKDQENSENKKICLVAEITTSSSSKSPIDDSLNKLLEKTLHNLPSFITASPAANKETLSNCQQCFKSIDLYRLPCIHIFCRICLTKTNNQCVNCDKKFAFCEIQKVHIDRSYNKL